MFTFPYVSCVTCHVSRVICHMSPKKIIEKKKRKKGKSGGDSRLRVCYQRGLPRLVFVCRVIFLSTILYDLYLGTYPICRDNHSIIQPCWDEPTKMHFLFNSHQIWTQFHKRLEVKSKIYTILNTCFNLLQYLIILSLIWLKPFIYEAIDSNKHSFVCVYLDGWIYWSD